MRRVKARASVGTTGAAHMAQQAGVDKLVLVHRGPNLEGRLSEDRARDDVSAIFDGEIILADELDIIEI